MRVAARYDIHGNLPALEAVLEDSRQAGADHVAVGGDGVPGPMPREMLRLSLDLDLPVQFIHGNCAAALPALIAGHPEAINPRCHARTLDAPATLRGKRDAPARLGAICRILSG